MDPRPGASIEPRSSEEPGPEDPSGPQLGDSLDDGPTHVKGQRGTGCQASGVRPDSQVLGQGAEHVRELLDGVATGTMCRPEVHTYRPVPSTLTEQAHGRGESLLCLAGKTSVPCKRSEYVETTDQRSAFTECFEVSVSLDEEIGIVGHRYGGEVAHLDLECLGSSRACGLEIQVRVRGHDPEPATSRTTTDRCAPGTVYAEDAPTQPRGIEALERLEGGSVELGENALPPCLVVHLREVARRGDLEMLLVHPGILVFPGAPSPRPAAKP